MTAKQILLVEDDRDIAALLQLHLEDEGYAIVHEDDGLRALTQLEQTHWDAVILDLMLPGVDGLAICRRIRERGRYLPVIIISARSSETERILGLETGADDYLAKPFSVQELVARIKALFRRQQAMGQDLRHNNGLIEAHGLVIDPLARSVRQRGNVVDLTPREFELLYFFARHPGEIFSRLDLLEQVWGYQHEGYEHTVNTHINRLRIKIEHNAAEPEIILTVWGERVSFCRRAGMSVRLNLSQRLTLLFILLLTLCATIAGAVQLYTSMQFGNAMVQRLSANLAQQIVQGEPLLDARGQVDRRTLKPLFDRLMTFNPSVELYVISPDGEILADAAPPGHIKRQRVDITPVEHFLNQLAMPVYGDDPRSLEKQKVFSAAPIRQDGELRGYLYIILQGEELNALAENAWHKTLWNTLLWSLLLVVVIGALVAMLVRHWVTRPVNQLIRDTNQIETDSISAIKQLAAQPTVAIPGDEVALLRNTFIELARKIASQWDQLADSDRQRREFIANISHDLRTPLTSLLGYLETLSMKAATLTPEESRHYLEIALRQGHKVRHLSQELFELARLEHGAIKPQRERFALTELVSDVVQKFDLPLETQRIALQTEIASHLPLVNADVSMVERVVTNLLDNAIRHTPAGGAIRLKIWQQAGELQMEIADSGPGIDRAMREQLFLRPSALTQQATQEKRGGLGLLIVKRMLELHGGGIGLVESTSGACFRFWLPYEE